MRLLPGWLAFQQGLSFTLDGDESIRRRPIDRIAQPLELMGARIDAREGRYPPFTVHGAPLRGIDYELPVASAQVKSCVLLAGLVTDTTTVSEPVPSRDHTERMLAAAGAPVARGAAAGGGFRTTVGQHRRARARGGRGARRPVLGRVPDHRRGARARLPAGARAGRRQLDPRPASCASSSGWGRSCCRMLEPAGSFGPSEPVADIDVRNAPIEGTTVEADEVPLAIDELPLVALLGCFAEGETIVRGAGELRVKESDRIATVVEGCAGSGRTSRRSPDGFAVRGTGGLRGGVLDAHGDHRLALLGAVAGLASREGVEVVGMEAAEVSYPRFAEDVAELVS